MFNAIKLVSYIRPVLRILGRFVVFIFIILITAFIFPITVILLPITAFLFPLTSLLSPPIITVNKFKLS